MSKWASIQKYATRLIRSFESLPVAAARHAPISQPAYVTPPRVAIARATDYGINLVRRQVRELLDALGGLDDIIRPGAKVALKVNLVGGTTHRALAGVSATESYVTHPAVVHALGEALRDAGARELFIVEGVWDTRSYQLWGYAEVAQALDAILIDLNSPRPYRAFVRVPVGAGWFTYEDFILNRVLVEVDALVSIAKMKCHWCCGVTLAMKNLLGLPPTAPYRLHRRHHRRSAMHGAADEVKTRLPRVVIDLNRARPMHLALIDGIKSAEGGEGPWVDTLSSVLPGVLIAGKNPVATDAVAAAVMGFDPTAEYPTAPFLRSDNHLNLARRMKLGTNTLEEIKISGAAVADVRCQFTPAVGDK